MMLNGRYFFKGQMLDICIIALDYSIGNKFLISRLILKEKIVAV